jgi:CBS domain-containing protein
MSRWASIRQACATLREFAADCLLVQDSGRLVGVLSSESAEAAPPESLIASFMSPLVIGVAPGTSLRTAVALFRRFRLACLAVRHDRTLIGWVTHAELARAGVPANETGPVCESCGCVTLDAAAGELPTFCRTCRESSDVDLGVAG